MDDLIHHCLRELSFDGDLGECIYHVMAFSEQPDFCAWVRIPYSTSISFPYFLPINKFNCHATQGPTFRV